MQGSGSRTCNWHSGHFAELGQGHPSPAQPQQGSSLSQTWTHRSTELPARFQLTGHVALGWRTFHICLFSAGRRKKGGEVVSKPELPGPPLADTQHHSTEPFFFLYLLLKSATKK